MNRRAIVFCFFIVSISVMGVDNLHPGRRLAWETPARIQAVLVDLAMEISPDLPAPILDHEKPYTRGIDNTVSWIDSMGDVYQRIDELQLTICFYAVEAMIADADTVWGFVDGISKEATFQSLPEGVSIAFRLRYYAQDVQGNYYISPWSNTEVSIQDASAPKITLFTIQQLQDTGAESWVLGPQISVHVQANDNDGQIMQIALQETSSQIYPTLFDDLGSHPRSVIDTTLQYTLFSKPSEPLTLKCWAVDVAEFYSDTLRIDFFYLLSDAKVVCFPNPFIPDQNTYTLIKVEKPDAEKAMIFDPFGNLIKTLRKDPSNEMAFAWDGKNERGEQVAKGGYLCIVDGDKDLYCKIAVIR